MGYLILFSENNIGDDNEIFSGIYTYMGTYIYIYICTNIRVYIYIYTHTLIHVLREIWKVDGTFWEHV